MYAVKFVDKFDKSIIKNKLSFLKEICIISVISESAQIPSEFDNMVWTKLFIYNIIIWLITSSKLLIRAEGKLNITRMDFNETQILKILPGIKFSLTNDKIIFHVKIQDLLQGICDTLFFLASEKYIECIFFSFRNGSAESKKTRKSLEENRIHDDDGAVCHAGFSFVTF